MQANFSHLTMGQTAPFEPDAACVRDFKEWYTRLRSEELNRIFQTGDHDLIIKAFPTWTHTKDWSKFSMKERQIIIDADISRALFMMNPRGWYSRGGCNEVHFQRGLISFVREAQRPEPPNKKRERADPTPIYVEDRKLKAYLRSYRP